MKKFLLGAAMSLTAMSASALGPDVFNHVGIGVGVGLTGITVEAATPITSFVQMRAGVSIMPGIKFNADADVEYQAAPGYTNYSEVELQGNLSRVQGQVIFNVYPIPKCNFFVAAGAYFGGNTLVKITGHCPELAGSTDGGVVIGDYVIPIDSNGNVDGGIRVNSFRPYFGVGFGRSVPGKLLAFNCELGVQIHGKPQLYTENGVLEISKDVYDDDTFQKIMDKVKVYPQLTFRLSFRAF